MGLISSNFKIDSFTSVQDQARKRIYYPPKYIPSNLSRRINYILNDQALVNNQLINISNITTLITSPKVTKSNINKYIVFSHGNATDIYNMYHYCKYLVLLHEINVICYDYPGYGESSGDLNEHTCYQSLNQVMEYLTKNLQINPQDIILIGQSLGTGIVVDYIYKTKWSHPVMLISPYKSLPRIIWDNDLIDNLVKNYKYASIDKIKHVICPIKIIHGLDDKLINIQHSQHLYEQMMNKKLKPIWLPETGHDDILNKIKKSDIDELINYNAQYEIME